MTNKSTTLEIPAQMSARLNTISQALLMVAAVEKNAKNQYAEQAASAAALFRQMRQTNAETNERKRLVEELDAIMPGLINKEELMSAKIADLATKEREYRDELAQTIRLQKNRERFTAMEEEKIALEEALSLKKAELSKFEELSKLPAYKNLKDDERGVTATGMYFPSMGKPYTANIENSKQDIANIEASIADITAQQESLTLTPTITHNGINNGNNVGGSIDISDGSTYDKQATQLKEQYARQEISAEEYQKRLDDIELAHLRFRLANEAKSDADKLKLRTQIAEKIIAINSRAAKDNTATDKSTAKAEKEYLQSQKQALDDYKAEFEATYKQQYANGLMSKEEYDAKMHLLNLAFLNAQLEQNKLNGEDTARVEAQIADQRLTIVAELSEQFKELHSSDIAGISIDDFLPDGTADDLASGIADNKASRSAAEKRFNLSGDNTVQEAPNKNSELGDIANLEMEGVLSHEEAEAAKGDIDKKYQQKRVDLANRSLQTINKGLSSASDLFAAMKAKELSAAGDNEEKKEEIRKKYAKKEKALAIAQATTSGALAIMSIWKGNITGNPVIDAIIKGTLTAAQVAMNVVQLSTIKSQQYASGRYPVVGADDGVTYSASYAGSLKTGVYAKPTLGLFSEKQPEMVVDGATTKRLVFDYPEIYNSILSVSRGGTPQHAGGLYPVTGATESVGTTQPSNADPDMKKLLQSNLAMMDALARKPISIPWYGKGGISEKMQKATKFENSVKIK